MSKEFASNDVKELNEVLDAVSDKVPALIKGVIGSFYSETAGRDMGKAVGSFYQELIAAGIPAADALEMAKNYMLSISKVSNLVKEANAE